MEDKAKLPEIFKFDERDVHRHIQYELKTFRRFGKSFDFVHKKLVKLNHHIDISNLKEFDLGSVQRKEGKNYDWLSITSGNVDLIIRQYNTHFTIYTKLLGDYRRYGSFTFYVNTDNMDGGECDSYYDNPFMDLNKVLVNLIEIVKKDELHVVWNDLSFERPEYCEVKLSFYGENISSVDSLIFCCEELSNIHLVLFAENEMLEKLKESTHRVGEEFEHNKTIRVIKTEFPDQYSDPYYHGVGIGLVDDKGEKSFEDVYSLTQWSLDKVFINV